MNVVDYRGCLPINVWKKESHGIHGRRIWIYFMGFLLLVDSMGFLPMIYWGYKHHTYGLDRWQLDS